MGATPSAGSGKPLGRPLGSCLPEVALLPPLHSEKRTRGNAVAQTGRSEGGSTSTKRSDANLIAWMNIQRRKYAEGRLSADTVPKLKFIPGWTWTQTTSQ